MGRNSYINCSIHFVDVILTPAHPYPMVNLRYERGEKQTRRELFRDKVSVKRSSCKKLPHVDEFLLTLMRLRLALLNKDLADFFGISKSCCSNTFLHGLKYLVLFWEGLLLYGYRES